MGRFLDNDDWLMRECLELWEQERGRDVEEAVTRVRALQEIGRRSSTEELLLLATTNAPTPELRKFARDTRHLRLKGARAAA